jgi:hypothetical protein
MTDSKIRTVGGLNTRTVRTRVTLSLAVDIGDVDFDGRMTKAEAERLAINYLLDNPQMLRDNLRVTLRLGKTE